jgi:hypothetical protein
MSTDSLLSCSLTVSLFSTNSNIFEVIGITAGMSGMLNLMTEQEG